MSFQNSSLNTTWALPFDKLNEKNYYTWRFYIETSLSYHGLSKTIESEECKDQDKNKSKVLITMSLDQSQIEYIRHLKTPKEIWDRLSEIHSPITSQNRLQLSRQFFSLKYEGGSMTDHLNKILTMRETLKIVGKIIEEEEIITVMLSSLPNEYESLILNLETQEKITLNNTMQRILQHEKRQSETSNIQNKNQKSEALFIKQKKVCQFCKKTNHYSNQCWFGPKNNYTQPMRTHWSQKRFGKNKQFISSPSVTWKNGKPQQVTNAKIITEENDNSSQLFFVNSNKFQSQWYIDSGASEHITNDKNIFNKFSITTNRIIKVGDNSAVNVQGIGEGNLKIGNLEIFLDNILYAPKISANLLSVSQLTKQGFKIIFNDNICTIIGKNNLSISIERKNNLYEIVGDNLKIISPTYFISQDNITNIWHKRLGHLSLNNLKKLETISIGIKLQNTEKEICSACQSGKQSAKSFPISETKTYDPLHIIHSDLCGPMQNKSLGGAKYFLTFIDNYTRYTWIYFLKEKSEVFKIFKDWKILVENQTERKIKIFRTDNGGEYCSNEFNNFLKNNGIIHQTTIPYTPEQNGVAERANRTIVECARSIIYGANLPLKFWAEAVNTAVYLKNRSPTNSLLNKKTPFEALYHQQPNLKHLKIFGCKAYSLIPAEKRKKLDEKIIKTIFIGYSDTSKAYKLFNPKNNQVILSRNVTFDESDFENILEKSISNKENIEPSSQIFFPLSKNLQNKNTNFNNNISTIPNILDENIPQEELNSEEVDELDTLLNSQPISRIPRFTRISQAHFIKDFEEPQTFEQAKKSVHWENWQNAMENEIKSININNTWKLVSLPKNREAIGSKWIFKIKKKSNGEIDRFKARLVAQGYTQQYGIDYDETFAPVVRYNTLRLLLALAAQNNWIIHQMDVETAFLNGELEEEIYLKQPKGFISEKYPNYVYKLEKSLYGLKQSSRIWHQKLLSELEKIGFKNILSDTSVFIKEQGSYFIILAVYVDDFLLFSNNFSFLDNLKTQLKSIFKMKDSGQANFILGMEIKQIPGKITICQEQYIKNILNRFKMQECKPVSTPYDKSNISKGGEKEEKLFPDITLYQQAVGSLIYLMIASRPDIGYAVSQISQKMHKPEIQDWINVKRIFRYLKGTQKFKLIFQKSKNENLEGFTDADWAGDTKNRKSTSGYIFKFAGGAISWSSQKQAIVALSTAEAEYIAATEAVKEFIWYKSFLKEIKQEKFIQESILYVDNQSAIAIIKNPEFHKRTKHIDIRFHFIRNIISQKLVRIQYCPTEEMIADIFTKGLFKQKHEKFTQGLGLLIDL